MARLFISYKREQQDYAFAIRQWLMDHQGWSSDDIFVDLDHLRAGVAWAERLFLEAESAQAMLFLASEASLHPDSFCYRELRRARGEVLAVTLGGVSPDDERLRRVLPYESLARQITALDQQPTDAFEFVSPVDASRGVVGLNRNQIESIGAVLRDLGIAPDSFQWIPREAGPYPGLAPLQEGDEAVFFGRDTEIRDTLRALAEMQERASCQVFLIQAPSGAGKSSFLRAGLWARLQHHAAFTPLAIVRASKGILTHPEWGLISLLHDARSNRLLLSRDEIGQRVGNDLFALLADLADSDRNAEGQRRTLLLGVDQAEEIGELGAEERGEFERLISAILSTEATLDVRLILTVRDDSVDGMLRQLERLGIGQEAIHTQRLHRLSTQRYRDIVQGPATAAQRAGWPLIVEQDLEIALAEAAGADRSEVGDALPLLAMALQRMVRQYRRPDGNITLQPEAAAGFLEQAIADAVIEALDEAGAAGTKESLAQLVVPYLAIWDPNVGEAGAARRVVTSSEVLFAGERAGLRPLANALVNYRLFTRTQDEDQPYYEVAHEALLRVPPMGEILYGLREQYLLAHTLKAEASAWARHARKDDHLARTGDRLAAAQALLADERFGPELQLSEMPVEDYLRACEEKMRSDNARDEALRKKELKLAQDRAEAAAAQQAAADREAAAAKQVARRTRLGLVITLVLLITTSILGWRAYNGEIRAQAAAAEAERQTEEALNQRNTVLITESRLLATFAQQEIQQQDFGNAIGLALRGLPQELDDPEARPLTLEPQQALLDSFHELREQKSLIGHEDGVYGALELQDGRLLTWSDDQTARLWQGDGTPEAVLRGHEGYILGALELQDGRLLTWGGDGTARLWQGDGTPGAILHTYEFDTFMGALELQDKRLLTWTRDGTARLWQSNGTPGPVLRDHENLVHGATELKDGRLLTWGEDGTARLWQGDGTPGVVLRGHEGGVWRALELQDGRLLTWGWDDGTARLWQGDGTLGAVLRGHEDGVLGAIELQDGRLLTWGGDGPARLWQGDGSPGAVLHGHEGRVLGALELQDGRLLTWSDDHTARLWQGDGTPGVVLRGHEGGVIGALELQDGRLLTWGGDGTARLWQGNGTPEAPLLGHEGGLKGALELQDGRLLTWSDDHTARLWQGDDAPGAVLRGHEGGVVGALELQDGRLLTWGYDGTARLWQGDGAPGAVLRGHEDWVIGALELQDGRLLTWSNDHTARLWQGDEAPGAVLRGHEGGVIGALELQDGRLLTWSNDRTARLWQGDGTPEAVLRGHEDWVLGALEFQDGRLLTWSRDGPARLWQGDGSPEAVLRGHEGRVLGALELRDGHLLTWGGDSTARLWQGDGTPEAVLRGHEGGLIGALELQDGRLLTWSGDSTARLWQGDGTPEAVLRGHEGGVIGALELQDGRLLTWCFDEDADEVEDKHGPARLWQGDGTPGLVLRGHERGVWGVLELQDGRLLTWDEDTTTRVWITNPAELIKWAREKEAALSPLSLQELCDFNLEDPEDCH